MTGLRISIGGVTDGIARQRFLGKGGLIALIVLQSMVFPISSDLFIPALPGMTEALGTEQSVATLSVTLFFLFMAVGMLLFGPISDKFGRKPVAVGCAAASVLFCIGCAAAPSIGVVLAFRSLHGLTGGGVAAISMALVKDCFEGEALRSAISVTQAMSLVAPLVAPLLGAGILQFGDWRTEFIALVVLMAVVLAFSLFLTEPLAQEDRVQGNVGEALMGIVRFARNRLFIGFVIFCGAITATHMAFIAIASYVFIDFFGTSTTVFGIAFAIASVAAIAGPLAYMRARSLSFSSSCKAMLVAVPVCGVAMLLLGGTSAVAFLIIIMPCIFWTTFARASVSNELLSRTDRNIGAASSFINFMNVGIGCFGMFAMSLDVGNDILLIAVIMLIASVVAAGGWLIGRKEL